jgi:Uma2 family endonuclease
MVTQREATVEDLYHAPDDGKYELVDGRLVRMSPTGVRPGHAALRIAAALLRSRRNDGRKGRKRRKDALLLRPLTFEEALKGLLATPSPPKEPKPKKDGGEKGE